MLQFVHDYKDMVEVLRAFAQLMGTAPQGNRLVLPAHFGSGYLEVLTLPNGLQAVLSDFTIHQDLFMKREKSKDAFYLLRIEEAVITDSLTLNLGGETVTQGQHTRAAALLTSSLFDFSFVVTGGSSIRGIHILLKKEWMTAYLGIKDQDEVLRQYLSLKTASLNMEPLDAGYRELLNELFAEGPECDRSAMAKVMIQNRIMLLVERFFTRLYEKMKGLKAGIGIKNDEILRIMDAEALLVRDFSVPAPTIAELARHTAMSETKFKNEFRKIYESGPYEYFQKNRMQRARFMLLSGKYSVKETGLQLGYNNLSNFTIAFKKEFGILPSTMVK
jgi:AraC-like DNA-binding protein